MQSNIEINLTKWWKTFTIKIAWWWIHLRQEAERPPCHKIGELIFLKYPHYSSCFIYSINTIDTPYIIRKTILKFVRNSKRSRIGKAFLSIKNKAGCFISSSEEAVYP